MTFKSLEAPVETESQNHYWLKDHCLMSVLAAVPIGGLPVAVGSLAYYYMNRETNDFNLAECSRKMGLFGLAMQVLYVTIYVLYATALLTGVVA